MNCLGRLMKLTTQTDFAVRTLMYLATVQRRATAAEVAALYGVSGNHMAKVVNLLSRLGYIRSVRGAGGGIEWGPDPRELHDRREQRPGRFHGRRRRFQCQHPELHRVGTRR